MQLSLFPELVKVREKKHVVNVASVPQRSPFRYPGGKTWLVPVARQWFRQADALSELIEPFAGGGIISLTAAAEHFFNRVTMSELDDDMAAAWFTIFSDKDCEWLIDKIIDFDVTVENIDEALEESCKGIKERAFATIVRNRTNHGGILACGAGKIKNGECGKGLSSRWYPNTLAKRILEANSLRDIIDFVQEDAFSILDKRKDDENAFFFIDPPYTIAGRRLYNLHKIDHQKLFEIVFGLKGKFLMTYDDTEEIRRLSEKYNLKYRSIPMQTTHLITKEELLISNDFEWMICK